MEDVITDSVAAPDLLDRSEWLPESFKKQQAQTGELMLIAYLIRFSRKVCSRKICSRVQLCVLRKAPGMESYISSTERSLVWLLGLFALSTSVKLWFVCHAIVSFFVATCQVS